MLKIEFQHTDEASSHQEIGSILTDVEKFSFVGRFSVLPPYVKKLKPKLSNKQISIASIVDFPFGILNTHNRLELIKESISDGADAIEIVMPSFLINNRQNAKIKQDIEECYKFCADKQIDLRYILEYRVYNYSCLSRLIKTLLDFKLENIYISTGYKLDDIYDHIIALEMILKENAPANIICNANIFNNEHLNILQSANLHHFRVNSINSLYLIREKYGI